MVKYKKNGHGLGLYLLQQELKTLGGNLEISNTAQGGGCVQIFFPICFVIKNLFKMKSAVLIEDDKYIRKSWSDNFIKNGYELHVFDCYSDPIKKLNKETVFFIDQNLRNQKGTDIACELAEEGFKNFYLVTSIDYMDLNLDEKLFIGVISKTPPF